MRLDQFSGLVAFLKVSETRSFTRAAAELGVSPAALSEAVKGLETRLGARLLNRTTRSVGLTEAGAAFLLRVRPAAEEIFGAAAALRQTGDRAAGVLRLSLPWIAGPLLIEPLMGPFLAAHPDVRLDLVFDDRFVDVAAEGFDAGVRIGNLVDMDMVAVRVGEPLRMMVLGSPAYLAEYGVPDRPADLARHRCIAYRFLTSGAVAPWEFHHGGRVTAVTPDPRLSANTLALAVAAAVEGIGLAYAAEALAAEHLRAGRLVCVLADRCPTLEPLHVYYPSRRLMPQKLAAFVAFARRSAGRSAHGSGRSHYGLSPSQ